MDTLSDMLTFGIISNKMHHIANNTVSLTLAPQEDGKLPELTTDLHTVPSSGNERESTFFLLISNH